MTDTESPLSSTFDRPHLPDDADTESTRAIRLATTQPDPMLCKCKEQSMPCHVQSESNLPSTEVEQCNDDTEIRVCDRPLAHEAGNASLGAIHLTEVSPQPPASEDGVSSSSRSTLPPPKGHRNGDCTMAQTLVCVLLLVGAMWMVHTFDADRKPLAVPLQDQGRHLEQQSLAPAHKGLPQTISQRLDAYLRRRSSPTPVPTSEPPRENKDAPPPCTCACALDAPPVPGTIVDADDGGRTCMCQCPKAPVEPTFGFFLLLGLALVFGLVSLFDSFVNQ